MSQLAKEHFTPEVGQKIKDFNKERIPLFTIIKLAEVSWSAWAARKEINADIEHATEAQLHDLAIKFEGMNNEQRGMLYVMAAYKLNMWAEFLTREGFAALLNISSDLLPEVRVANSPESRIELANKISHRLEAYNFSEDFSNAEAKVFYTAKHAGILEGMIKIHNSAWSKSRVDMNQPKHYWMRPYDQLSNDPATSKFEPTDLIHSYTANLTQVMLDFAYMAKFMPQQTMKLLDKLRPALFSFEPSFFTVNAADGDFSRKYEPSPETLQLFVDQ